MALTQTRPDAATEAPTPVTELPLPGGLAGVLGSGDHKTIGRLWVGFGLLFGLVAYVVGALADLAPIEDLDVPPDDIATQIVNLRPFALVFLFAAALVVGLTTYVAPLQVGSNTVAFPRAAAASLWTWVVGSALLLASFAMNGGPGGGIEDAGEVGSALFLVALIVVLGSLVMAMTCVATTVVGLRTAGMNLYRVPLLAWSSLVTAAVWALTFPVLAGTALLAFVDFQYGPRTGIGAPETTMAQLSWFFQGPAVYLVAIPVLGIAADAVATLTGRRLPVRGGFMATIGVFGALAFGPWVAPAINPEVHSQAAFVGVSCAIVVPVLALLGAIAAHLRGGAPKLASPVVLALVSLLLLALATVAGAAYSIEPLEVQGTAWAQGHGMLVVAAGGAGLAAGLFLWAPKMWGHTGNDGLGKLAAPLFLLGGVLSAVPQMVIGLQVRFEDLADATDLLSGLSAAGDAVLAVAVVVVAVGMAGAARGASAPDDPWGSALTLEWATSSPPPRGNFGELAPVTSPEPLLDLREGTSEGKAS